MRAALLGCALAATPLAARAQPACRSLADFDDPGANERWTMRNDDVMGGRSIGGVRFEDSAMVFSGNIDTNGGGFSSVRLTLLEAFEPGDDRVVLRVRTDGRGYRVLLEDRARPRIVYRADFPDLEPGGWETIEVAFPTLQPSVSGDPVEAPAFEPEAAWRIGLMLNDVEAGPFELAVDRVEVCG